MDQKATYTALEGIRAEMDCDGADRDNNPLCERLEDIMDRVWGYCPPTEAIWESSMSEARGE